MDKRIINTQNAIKTTFLEMLKDDSIKDVKDIKVCELCKRAKVNRATFYKYYEDQYDLLKTMQEDFILELKTIPKENAIKINLYVKEILNIFLKNKELCQILMKTSGIYFLSPFIEVTYDVCYDIWKKRNSNLTEDQISCAAVFLFNGSLGIINWWVARGYKESVEEIAMRIQNLSYLGLKTTLEL